MAMFPDEILLNILGHLEDEYNQDNNDSTIIKHTLLDLCQSSKFFCIAAQPIHIPSSAGPTMKWSSIPKMTIYLPHDTVVSEGLPEPKTFS